MRCSECKETEFCPGIAWRFLARSKNKDYTENTASGNPSTRLSSHPAGRVIAIRAGKEGPPPQPPADSYARRAALPPPRRRSTLRGHSIEGAAKHAGPAPNGCLPAQAGES